MSLLELWNLTPAEADAFAERYWTAKDARLEEFYAWSGQPAQAVTRASLVAAMGWTIEWWLAGGSEQQGGEWPMWYVPHDGIDARNLFYAPALRAADALGYLWLDYVTAHFAVVHRGRCIEETLLYNKPVIWITEQGNKACPFDHGYRCMLGVRSDRPAGSAERAGRDPRVLADLADGWIAMQRIEVRAQDLDEPPATNVTSGDPMLDAELSRLGLAWPLHELHVDEDEIEPGEPQELHVVFDDVAAYEYEHEIDQLAEHLKGLADVDDAERAEREYVLVELKPGISASKASARIDAAATQFMRTALRQRPT